MAETKILQLQQLQGQSDREPYNKDLVQLKEMEKQLQDTLQLWKDDRKAQVSQHVQYQKDVAEQIEQKNAQLGELHSSLKRVQDNSELNLYRTVEAERQKWEAHEAKMILLLDRAMGHYRRKRTQRMFLYVKD